MSAPRASSTAGWRAFSNRVCNALSDKASAFLEKHLGVDLIIVTGPTGVGKSSFIKAITGSDLYISSTLESGCPGTRQTALVPASIRGKRYLFLDMPGFDAADLDDWHVFTLLTTAMGTIERYVNFRGLVYIDTFDNVRATRSAEKILTWIYHFCGPQYMANVTIVTTKWDVQADELLDEKLDRFTKWSHGALLQPLISNGAKTFHHGLIQSNGHRRKLSLRNDLKQRASLACEMIHIHYNSPSNGALQIYQEIASGCRIEMTSAGKYLRMGFVQEQGFQPTAAMPGSSVPHAPDTSQKNENSKPAPMYISDGNPHDPRQGNAPPHSWSWVETAREIKSWVELLLHAFNAYNEMPSDGGIGSDEAWSESETAWKDGDYFEDDWRHFPTSGPYSDDGVEAERPQESSNRCVIL
ncbi:hypothetical protein BKA63DRAFT_28590 [Paraphoma chrysanthemicola]|nr:hypothetical protein BKA63DRAFT_28590 [Paraphoma chrysanthemicola]